MNKIFRILEIFWMSMAVIGVCTSVYFLIIGDSRSALFFLIFTIVSVIIYLIRKRQRKIYEAAQKKDKK